MFQGSVSEIDRAVGLHHHVVGLVEGVALEAVGDHGDAAVGLFAGDPPRQALAGDQPALGIAGQAVGAVGLLLGDGGALPRRVLDAAVFPDRAEQEIAALLPPHRAFGVAAAAETGRQLQDRLRGGNDLVEFRLERVDPLGRLGPGGAAIAEGEAARRRHRQHAPARNAVPGIHDVSSSRGLLEMLAGVGRTDR